MKTLLSIITLIVWTASSAFASLMIPINPAPAPIVHCNHVGNHISCSNGVMCTIQPGAGSAFVSCNNRMTCTVWESGMVSCNNGNNCHQTGTNLYCNQGLRCMANSPTHFSCHL
ncbi:hypothetical protein QJS83_14325 [Bdellovibrio sp. 22V]|uniref:hypothetical protein n=1 Tax=Bdellovibrio TaxID=958 RepID=UPI0025429CFD|nr:hypothetical protein [Bdellovibrio sp. 22V]WII71641.1 hypothetical protein QJS83_14325 [Bdellovibrio sp. 22V]